MICGESLGSGRVFDLPAHQTDVNSWHQHIPFAFWCVDLLRPGVVVELGCHKGDSYMAFCQAIERVGIPASACAVDTWQGDHQAGFYDEKVLAELKACHDPRYGSFSRLIRATFDEASTQFADGSIDLLHIDGLHTYEAVRHDFETWRPKLSRRGVVLFHDVNVHEADFGAWRFWEEVSASYPSFTFFHGYGLGVLLVGAEAPEAARRLASCSPEQAARVRDFFARLGEQHDRRGTLERRQRALEGQVADLEGQRAGLERQVAEGHEAAERRSEEGEARHAARERELTAILAARDSRLAALEGRLAELEAGTPLNRLVRRMRTLPARLEHGAAVAFEFLGWALRFRLREGIRLRKDCRIIRRSHLFDVEHYLTQCGDDKAARRDPIRHYLTIGASKGYAPNPCFDAAYYREKHEAARRYPKDALLHYVLHGASEGLEPGPDFDPGYYLVDCPSAKGSGLSPLAHYLLWGRGAGYAGRRPAELMQVGPGERTGSWVLVVDHRLLTPDRDSGSVRMYALIRLLREIGHEVTFVSDSVGRNTTYEQLLGLHGVPVVYGEHAARAHLQMRGPGYRHVLLSRPEQAYRYLPMVRAHCPEANVVYDTVDLHWVRCERAGAVTGQEQAGAEVRRYRFIERANALGSDLVLAITPEERQMMLAEVPGVRVEVIPNIHKVSSACPGPEGRRDLMFIGGYEHEPNVDAVEWFVREILPHVQRELPEVVLNAVGSSPPQALLDLASASVKVLGYVPDPDPFFHRSRVFVSPLRYGAGMKGKIGQAMSLGLPVVTTSVGAEGMMLVDGENALVADDPQAFAQAVLRLHHDRALWERLSANGRRHIEAHFSEAVVRARLASIFPIDPALGTALRGSRALA